MPGMVFTVFSPQQLNILILKFYQTTIMVCYNIVLFLFEVSNAYPEMHSMMMSDISSRLKA